MTRVELTASGATMERWDRGFGRSFAWLPVGGVAALIVLMVAHGYNPLNPPSHPPKRLERQAKLAPPPIPAPADERDRIPAPEIDLSERGWGLEPVASAIAPGSRPDGGLRIAASFIPRIAPATPAAKLVVVEHPESPGNAAPPVTARVVLPPPAHPEQLAALTPPSRALPPERPLTVVAPPAPLMPYRAYAQPFDMADRRPRVAVVVAGNDETMDRAIDTLPPSVTLAMDPYARRLPEWIELARAKGHEVLLTLSMPTLGHGRHEAGPMAILSSLDPKENLDRLDWALDRTKGFVGVLDIVGNRPATERMPILARLKQHGLMLVSGTGLDAEPAELPLAIGDAVLTPDLARRDIGPTLRAFETKVRRNGHAVIIGIADPIMLRQIAAWVATLQDKSIAVAPATALIAPAPASGIARE